jgi:hypothetical protein
LGEIYENGIVEIKRGKSTISQWQWKITVAKESCKTWLNIYILALQVVKMSVNCVINNSTISQC